MYRFLPGIVRKKANNSASSSTTTTENKGIDLGLSGTKQKNGERVDSSNVEPGYSVQKHKRANSDSECSLKEPATKKQRLDASPAHVTDKENSFSGLPNEMFQMILEYLSTSDLFNCRQVNHQWNAISSQIIRGRDDITIHFEFTNGQFVQRIDHQHREKLFDSTSTMGSKTLADIVNCIRDAKQFPFTSFRFDGLSNLRNSAMRDFLAVFGKEIRSFETYLIYSEEISETLRKLVFEEAPNLKILGIQYDSFHEDPTYVCRLVESISQLQLPKLEVLRTNDVYPKIIEAIMMSSANLKSISIERCFNTINSDDLQILKRAGKLHCLKNVNLVVGQEIIAQWLKTGPIQLESLYLTFVTLSDNQQLMLSVTQTVGQLLQSIRNTLQSFNTEPLGFLTGLVLPRFEKLKKLSLRPSFGNFGKSHPFLPPLLDFNDTFPNLKELDIDLSNSWLDATFRESLKTLPSVETLRIKDGYKGGIEYLIKFTPNVKTLVIAGDSIVWYEESDNLVDFRVISTYLPKLENFGWEMSTGIKDISRIPHMYNFDAAITGLPVNLCKKLAKKFRNKNKLTAAEVAKYHSKKSQPSIFDLKGLKTFYVELTVIDELALDMDDFQYDSDDSESELWFDPECNSELTKVSKFLGFDLMPNLKFFVHTVHYPG